MPTPGIPSEGGAAILMPASSLVSLAMVVAGFSARRRE
jgi:hypothetical protein